MPSRHLDQLGKPAGSPPLIARQDVGVDRQRHDDRGVPEPLADHVHRLTSLEQHGGVRVPEIMQPHLGDVDAVADSAGHGLVPGAAEVLGLAVAALDVTEPQRVVPWPGLAPACRARACEPAGRSRCRGRDRPRGACPSWSGPSVTAAPSPLVRIRPADRRTATVPPSRSTSRQRSARASPRLMPVKGQHVLGGCQLGVSGDVTTVSPGE